MKNINRIVNANIIVAIVMYLTTIITFWISNISLDKMIRIGALKDYIAPSAIISLLENKLPHLMQNVENVNLMKNIAISGLLLIQLIFIIIILIIIKKILTSKKDYRLILGNILGIIGIIFLINTFIKTSIFEKIVNVFLNAQLLSINKIFIIISFIAIILISYKEMIYEIKEINYKKLIIQTFKIVLVILMILGVYIFIIRLVSYLFIGYIISYVDITNLVKITDFATIDYTKTLSEFLPVFIVNWLHVFNLDKLTLNDLLINNTTLNILFEKFVLVPTNNLLTNYLNHLNFLYIYATGTLWLIVSVVSVVLLKVFNLMNDKKNIFTIVGLSIIYIIFMLPKQMFLETLLSSIILVYIIIFSLKILHKLEIFKKFK